MRQCQGASQKNGQSLSVISPVVHFWAFCSLHLNKMQKSDAQFVDTCNKYKVSEPSVFQIHKYILDLEIKWIQWLYLWGWSHILFLYPHNRVMAHVAGVQEIPIDWHKEIWTPFPYIRWLCSVPQETIKSRAPIQDLLFLLNKIENHCYRQTAQAKD